MNVEAVLVLILGAGIFVGIKSKRLTVTELVVCGSFGLLIGGFTAGQALRGGLIDVGDWALTTVTGFVS